MDKVWRDMHVGRQASTRARTKLVENTNKPANNVSHWDRVVVGLPLDGVAHRHDEPDADMAVVCLRASEREVGACWNGMRVCKLRDVWAGGGWNESNVSHSNRTATALQLR